MQNAFLRHFRFLLIVLVSYTLNAHAASESTYESVQWEKRGNATFYCIDITDENGKVHPFLQAVKCGENFYHFSPKEYLVNMRNNGLRDTPSLPEDKKRFGWKVYARDAGYAGPGYEGIIEANCVDTNNKPYPTSAPGKLPLEWGCRLGTDDYYYSINILKEDGSAFKESAACSGNNCPNGLHRFDPTSLNLPAGKYKWQIWSYPSKKLGGEGFEGSFQMGSEGKVLFSTHCSECHKDPKDSKIATGVDPVRIREAIASKVPQMNKLNSLDSDILQKIANYIKNPD
jgi:hypothetical protein